MVVGTFSSRGGTRQLRSKPTMVLYIAMDPQGPPRRALAIANKTVTSDPAGPQTRVETDVWSTPPSKTQGFLTIRVVFFDSAAEWRCPCAQRISFYKGFRDFVDHCVTSISFYDEFCALERPVFSVFLARASRVVFYEVFISIELFFCKSIRFYKYSCASPTHRKYA